MLENTWQKRPWFLENFSILFPVFSDEDIIFWINIYSICIAIVRIEWLLERRSEAAARGVLWKKVFLEISQNSLENTCARVSFLIKLQASGFFWIPFFLIVEVSFLHILYEFCEIKCNEIYIKLFRQIVWKKYFTVYSRL